MGIGNSYGTFEEKTGYTEEKDLHIHGTIPRGTKLEFWLTRPRPKGINIDDWEVEEEARWDRLFGKEETTEKLDRYFKKQDGSWGMVHIGCLNKVPKESRDGIFRDAVREEGSNNIQLESPLNISFPVVACCLCEITGRLGTWRENKWQEEKLK